MAYKKNIPQADDKLRNSQQDLLENFQQIDNWVNVDHVGFGSNEGKHEKVSLREQGSTPTFGADEVGLYNKVPNITGYTNKELHVLRPGGTDVPITARSSNWAYLASNVLIKTGKKDISSAGQPITVDYEAISGGPPLNQGDATVMITPITTGLSPARMFATLEAVNIGTFSVRLSDANGNAVQGRIQYIVIGLSA